MVDTPPAPALCVRKPRCTNPCYTTAATTTRAATPSPCRSRTRRRTSRRSPQRREQHCHDDVLDEHCDYVVHRHSHSHSHNQRERKRTWLEAALHLDHSVSAWVHAQGLGMFFYALLRLLEFSGDGTFLIPCAAATFLAPRHKLTPEIRMFFFNLFMTFVFDLIFVSILKKIVRRPRPSYNSSQFLSLQVDHWSFPSGHSTRALIIATTFALYLPMWRDQARRVWMPFVIYELKDHVVVLKGSMYSAETLLIRGVAGVIVVWALAITTSRTILGRHFLCDVLAGSMIGVGEAFFSYRYLFIPMRNCEYVYDAVNRQCAWLEDSFYSMASSRNFVVSQVKRK